MSITESENERLTKEYNSLERQFKSKKLEVDKLTKSEEDKQ